MMTPRIQKTLDTNIATLTDRLTKGWDYCKDHPDDGEADALWLDLLEQYERAMDARYGTHRKEYRR